MGVDAEMLVRIKGKQNQLSESEVRRVSYEIGTAFDNNFFFTMNPRQGVFKETRRALEIMRPLKDAAEAADYGLDSAHAGRVVWSQDGDPIVAAEDEQFIKVNLYGRYYGKGYERGDWPKLRACIFWLSTRIPNCEVWYGGDSSGICAEHATPLFMADLDQHWVANARRPYVRYESPHKGMFGRMPKDDIEPPVCELCEVPMAEQGGSRDYSFFWCDGCGAKASKHYKGGFAWAGLHEDYPYFEPDGLTAVKRKKDAA